MSYINDALRKAQRERDGRYERFGGIIATGPEKPRQPRKRRLAIGAAFALVVLIPAGLILAVYVLAATVPDEKGGPPAGRRGQPRTDSVRYSAGCERQDFGKAGPAGR